MARITVEDCLEKVANRFDLIMLAAQRARELGAGVRPTVPADRDKPTLIALREIAAGTVTPEALRDSLVKRMRRAALEDDETDGSYGDSYSDSYSDEFGAAGRTSEDFADIFGAEDAASEAGEAAPQRDDEIGDLADMPEPSEEELAEMETDTALDEQAA
ncbi:MAG: DNA-directed RNA polymerase subunit omega [Kiloniellaceae bacterium]